MMGTGWRLFIFWSLPGVLIVAGTIGYRAIERWSWFDSFYVAVITLTSIGYGDKHAYSLGGKVLTLSLALVGISAVAVAATQLLSVIITGELRDSMGKRRMRKRIASLEGQVIVCGYGYIGRHVCAELLAAGVPVVAVDRREERLAAARKAGTHFVLGEATSNTTLRRAGIQRARALVAVAGSDADNILITMAARLLYPDLPIVSCVNDEASMPKLMRAGATRAASPPAIVGGRMARAALHPSVLDDDLLMEEELVRPGSPLDGKTVGSSGLRSRGLVVVAIKRRDGSLALDPEDDVPVAAGDTLITIGSRAPDGLVHELAFLH